MEERYRTFIQTIPDIVYEVEAEGRFTFLNNAVRQLGYNPEELMGKHFKEIIHPDDFENVSHLVALPKYKGRITGDEDSPKFFDERRTVERMTKNLEVRLRLKDKEADYCWAELHSFGKWDRPVVEKNKKLLGSIGIIRDITERKKMEERLQREKIQRLESIGVLAGGLAHDFNNILTVILGNIALAKMDLRPGDAVFKRLDQAEKASDKARNLTHQLLTFSRGGAPIKETVFISRLITDSVGFGLAGSNLRCYLSISHDLWPVECDQTQIVQALNNLIVNAREAQPAGGRIEVWAENTEIRLGERPLLAEGKYVKILVRDYGTGISQGYLPHIFDPYFTTKEKRSGLGLAIAHSIIIRHNGEIKVESEPGKGTSFVIFLPASFQEAVIEKEEEIEEPAQGKGKILLMDDEEDILQIIREALETFGYNVETACDGDEAIKLYQKAKEFDQPFDAVILDLVVPGGMGGKETISKLIEIDPKVKVIVASGYSDYPVLADFKDYGFYDTVAKPYRPEKLNRILRRVMKAEGNHSV
ncbi:MAG: ATP-binding protein [bacterium]